MYLACVCNFGGQRRLIIVQTLFTFNLNFIHKLTSPAECENVIGDIKSNCTQRAGIAILVLCEE
jgi:hypothetical protein